MFTVYSFQLVQHTNIKYREALLFLGRNELLAMLSAIGIHTSVELETMGGASFLSFEAPDLSDSDLAYLSMHSAISFMAEKEGSLLRPLTRPSVNILEEDLPEILKYKGKTSVSFTRTMINVALSLTPFIKERKNITILDPLCGKCTTAFCALQWGMNAVGIDLDQKDLSEAVSYFSRYLKLHGLKHTLQHSSETIGKSSVPSTLFTLAPDKENWTNGNRMTFRIYKSDSANASSLLKKSKVHVIVADLPYGIQHAPQVGVKTESFLSLLDRALPSWYQSLLPGGAIALSFNTLTLPTARVAEKLKQYGFSVCDGSVYTGFRHEVEQAVVRDVVFAIRK